MARWTAASAKRSHSLRSLFVISELDSRRQEKIPTKTILVTVGQSILEALKRSWLRLRKAESSDVGLLLCASVGSLKASILNEKSVHDSLKHDALFTGLQQTSILGGGNRTTLTAINRSVYYNESTSWRHPQTVCFLTHPPTIAALRANGRWVIAHAQYTTVLMLITMCFLSAWIGINIDTSTFFMAFNRCPLKVTSLCPQTTWLPTFFCYSVLVRDTIVLWRVLLATCFHA